MYPPGADTVLVRHGDVNTKSRRVKRRMEGFLAENVEALLADRGIPGEVERRWNRPLVHTDPDRVAEARGAASDAFGVVSASACLTTEPDLDAITDALAEVARERYEEGSFAIDARRANKELPFTSQDVAREGGDAVWRVVEDEGEFEPEVDLDDPDLTFAVEVHGDVAFLSLDVEEGPGGLPLRTQAPLVALVSGGIDSPVAAYEAMRRGSPVVPVYVDLGDYGGPDHEARAIETVSRLAEYAPNTDLSVYRVPGGETVAHLAETMEQGRMLSLRRFFYLIAERVAGRTGARGIVTGEAIGQKSSQTVRNLAVTDEVTDLPIHRPLLAWDKQEIIATAREIGTFEESTIDAGCNRIAPDQAETNARLDRLLEVEPDDLAARAERAASEATVVEP
ncbi:tRNA sulfurtransferase [Saliphagus infecundisoli]|uniref:Probable tRNA sulfurtransferase n=1 Tax=Saliphagus infecundisoli TaxID=1849069 RepID=A0ABD5QFA6_9EURY|nr:tRNA sulfurtransferase [Saliphagus infecundisoli]